MKGSLRQSMTWLHTWSGLVLGWVLFIIFLMGTLSYFRVEITHWMQPEQHVSYANEQTIEHAYDRLVQAAPKASDWKAYFPDARSNVVKLYWTDPTEKKRVFGAREIVNAANGDKIENRETAGGNFLFRFHYRLYGIPKDIAYLLVEIATMFMFIAILSGIIMHRKIFTDFFMLRTNKRSVGWLDSHAVSAVLSLPFHLMITFSGLLFLADSLVWWADDGGNNRRRNAAVKKPVPEIVVNYSQRPNLTTMLVKAEQRLGAIRILEVKKPGRPEATFSFVSGKQDMLLTKRGTKNSLTFDADGELLKENKQQGDEPDSSVVAASSVVKRLHRATFADTPLRWAFFVAGVLGSFMVASGSILWSQKRAKQQTGQWGFELVKILNLAFIGGLCLAVAAYFWSNRLLPIGLDERPSWEITSFFSAWALASVYAVFFRNKGGWQFMLSCLAVLFISLPILDHFTSSVGLLTGIKQGDMLRLGCDFMLLILGAICSLSVWILRRKAAKFAKKAAKKSSVKVIAHA